MKMTTFCAVAAASVVLSACGSSELDRTWFVEGTGSEFDRALFSEYLTLSRVYDRQGNRADSDLFALRARSVAGGSAVEPVEVASRAMPAAAAAELAPARGRLVAALQGGARERAPRDVAKAQAMFDCWVEEQAEPRQFDAGAECRSVFLAALARIEGAPTSPAPQPDVISVYFDRDSATLNGAARREVDRIVARIRSAGATRIGLTGHTDRAGAADYNTRLSRSRVAAVRDAIRNAGVSVQFAESIAGEDRPAVPTADNVSEARNRRVEVRFLP